MKNIRQLLAAVSLTALCACASTDISDADQSSENYFLYAGLAPEEPTGFIQARPMPSAPLDVEKTLTRIVFASCAHQNEDQSIWDQIASENPDLVLYMGDNVYGDVRSDDPALPELKAAYMRLSQSKPFSRVRKKAPVIAAWDDHDYGMNDAGDDYQYKKESEALFDYVWAVGADDPRAGHEGTYGAWMVGGEDGKRVQIIQLDTRYFRSPLLPTDERGKPGKERYIPDADPEKTMLGAAQWTWLTEELKKPADLRLLVSSIQVIADGHGWEAWRTLPAEREKLYTVIDEAGAENLIILSGDRHSAALYQRDDVIDYPLFEATSSSLNLPVSGFRPPDAEPYMEPGPNRLGDMYEEANYGVLEIDWADSAIEVTIRDANGEPVRTKTVDLETLR